MSFDETGFFAHNPDMIIANIATDIAKNYAMGLPVIRQLRLRGSRTCGQVSQEGLDRQIDKFIDPVLATSGGVFGKSILEIGPGDNFLAGLAFLAEDALSYTALDRFPGDFGNETAVAWYDAYAERISKPLPRYDDPRVSIVRQAVEITGDIGQFDIVCSHAVGEHVSSVAKFGEFTKRSMSPNGIAIHVIDFSGHHWHRDNDPDLFRRFPNWLWHAMGSNRGLPNRVPPADFLRHFRNAGLDCDFDLQGTHGVLVCRNAGALSMAA